MSYRCDIFTPEWVEGENENECCSILTNNLKLAERIRDNMEDKWNNYAEMNIEGK